MAFTLYAWGNGFNVALGSLRNVENDLLPYTQPRRVAPRSQPIDQFPVRTILASGQERGDGRIDHQWEFTALPAPALNFILTSFGLLNAVSVPVTIYTRMHDRGSFVRVNSYMVKPKPGETLDYLRGGVLRAVFTFRGLVESS